MKIEIRSMSKRFGGLQALDSVSVFACTGEVTAVIGPNGSGKSTLVNCVSGTVTPDSGVVAMDGVDFAAIAPQHLVEVGISRTFQTVRLWEHLTCREHVSLARTNYLSSSRARSDGRQENAKQSAGKLLERLGLGDKSEALPSELSYGEKRRLEIARALAIDPKLLLLDEPAAGFTLSEQAALGSEIVEIAKSGVAIILIEHHMDLVAQVSSRVTVLNFGRVLTTGTIAEVRNDPEVISAYLGVST